MLVEFFIIGGVWFWLLCCIEVFVLFGTVNNESPWGAFWSLFLFVALIHLFGNADWLTPLKTSPLVFVGWALAYLSVGLCWSFGRLWFWVRDEKQRQIERFKDSSHFKPSRPSFSQIKDRIATWVAYWPVSMLWTLLSDILSELGRKITEQFRGFYEAIIRSVWGDLDEQERPKTTDL